MTNETNNPVYDYSSTGKGILYQSDNAELGQVILKSGATIRAERFGFWQADKSDLMLHHDLHTFLSKLDPDLCHYSGIRYKSELDDCGVSVDGRTKGNGWKIRISWDMETTVLWSPNLKALLNSALEFLKTRVKPDTSA